MDDSPGEATAAAHSEVREWSSYSLPSQPPDIRNWFASYEYESPEDSELVADPGAHNGSETQDPFEGLQHPVFPGDDGVAVRKNRLGGQSEDHFLDRKDLVPADENESTVQKPPKRKQSLRALFGFLEEASEPEFQVALPAQRNAVEPPRIGNATRLLYTKQGQEGAIKSGKVSVHCNCISSVDTQVSFLADQEVGCSEQPVTCVNSSLADIQNSFQKNSIENDEVLVDFKGISSVETQFSSPADQELKYRKLPVNCVNSSIFHIQKCLPDYSIGGIKHDHDKLPADSGGISSVDTQVSSPADQEVECSKLPVNCVNSSIVDIQKCSPDDSINYIEHGKLPADSGGISSVDTQVSSPVDQEVEYSKPSGTNVVSGLAAIHQEDGIDSFELPINIFGTNLDNIEKGSRDGSEHNILHVCQDNIILADTKENSPVKEFSRCKPALDSNGPEQTVASDGFVAIKRKRRLPEECKTNKIPKHPMRRDKAALQENHNVLGRKALAQVPSRSPLADRTNFTEAAAAPSAEFSGKWKCPSEGKPRVGPPMKQLRLDKWLC